MTDYRMWVAGTNGRWINKWFVIRYLDGPGVTGELACGSTGKVRLFYSRSAANKAAECLNACL